MKKVDLNNPETIKKFKDTFNSLVDKKINEASRNYLLNTFENIGVNRLACLFESISDKLIDTDEGKSLLARYVKAINENKSLKKIYQFRNAIMNPITENSDAYLNEVISISEGIDPSEYEAGKKKISQILRESVNLAKLSSGQIVESAADENRIQTAAEYIITNKKSFKNLSEYVSNKEIVRKYIDENKKTAETIDESENKTVDDLISELNENLLSMEDWRRNAVSRLTESRLAKRDDKELFEEFKKQCLDRMEEKIEETDDSGESSKLALMKEQLSAKEYNESEFMNDLMNLAELKETLSE